MRELTFEKRRKEMQWQIKLKNSERFQLKDTMKFIGEV